MTVSATVREDIGRLLGREPRGLRDVPVRDAQGRPVVIRVASLVDEEPFPTLFWLVDPHLCYRIDQEEAGGLIAQLQERVDADEALQDAMRTDHRAHIALRNTYIEAGDLKLLQALGFYQVLQQRGIGGIADFTRIRCLHTWYGSHLVVPNTIGRLLEAHWSRQE